MPFTGKSKVYVTDIIRAVVRIRFLHVYGKNGERE